MELAEWLTSKCGVDSTHAGMLKTILEEQYWINSVGGLAARNAIDANLLGSLKAPDVVKTAIKNALLEASNNAAITGKSASKQISEKRDHYETRSNGVTAVSPAQTPPAKKQKCVAKPKLVTNSLDGILQALTKKGIDDQMRALASFQHELKSGKL